MNTEEKINYRNADSTTSKSEQTSSLIRGTENADILFGTPGDDEIFALGGNDIIIGTIGSDLISGGDGIDTIDYSDLSNKITLLPGGVLSNGSPNNSQIEKIEIIIGAIGQANTIDASSSRGGVSLDVNLEKQRLTVKDVPGLGIQEFTVENFVNLIGTPEADNLIGSKADNRIRGLKGDDNLGGNGGSDFLSGDRGNDTLTGTDGISRGVGELDVLKGGAGIDLYILGDENGSFYQEAGNRDLARIRDFSFGEQIQLGADETYNIERDGSQLKVFLTTESQNELIADVRIVTSSIAESRTRSIESIEPIGNTFLNGVPEGEFTISAGETIDIFVGA